ncbi:sulfatase [Aquimarina algicola]|uniref:Sulfatase n=1 Tax=Aquimarina algicola TaxID=2589995 RepID=A0A504JCQ4_9FLAO|nr:sulfatase [Aquimarina algicola]TPN86235.1 sulfatase [Aquimarina algicola]
MKKSLLKIILSFLIISIIQSCKNDTPPDQKKSKNPNIIFVLVDDLGYGDVGFNGSKYFETPTLDKLSKESLVLDNAYMYPTCSPSRAAIFTGKQSFRTGVYTVPVLEKGSAEENIFSRWTVEKKHPIYAEPLQKAGYRSVHVGKWHIVGPYPNQELAMQFPIQQKLTQPQPGDFTWVNNHKTPEVKQFYPEGRGFIKNVGGTFRGDPALEEGGYKSKTGGYWAPFSNPFIDPKPDDNWLTDRLTDEAIDFIDANKDEPFLINLHYYAVHRPIKARSEELLQKYMTKPVDSVTGQGIASNEKRKQIYAGYATMVESVDDNMKKLLKYLDNNGLRENTILIFTSDNGSNSGQSRNDLLRGSKGQIYEGGIKVPMLVNWPEKIKPRRSDVAVTALDIFPTFMDLANIKTNNNTLDGRSITTLFKEDDKSLATRSLFWHIASKNKHGTCSVIRKNNFKLIQFLADGKLELYDLKNDTVESTNLAEEKPEITKELLTELVTWRKTNAVPLPPNSILEY